MISTIKLAAVLSAFLVSFGSIGCSNADTGNVSVTGKYATHGPSVFRGKLLNLQYHASIWPMALIHLYLRTDGCFVAGTCNNQIWQAGHYKVSKDTIIMYDIYDFEAKKSLPDNHVLYERKRKQVLFRYHHWGTLTNEKTYPESLATLEQDWHKGEFDFLRNEDWSLDSLLKCNTYWDKQRQSAWMDSMLKVKHIGVVNARSYGYLYSSGMKGSSFPEEKRSD